MGKLLRTTDRVLIGLSLVGEVLEKFSEVSPTKKKWLHNAYGFFPEGYKKNSYYASISKMLSDQIIERVIVKGQAKLRISSIGKKKLSRDFPFLDFQNNKWDGRWRIVTFDIPVKKSNVRDRLRYKLKELGFGMLQQSIWISPHKIEDDIREFFELNKLGSSAYIFVSEKLLAGNIGELVNKLWDIKKVNSFYKKAFEENDKEAYYKALSIDPFLPKDLLPKDWYGNKVFAKLSAGAG